MSLESLSKLDGIVFFNEKWHDGTTPIMSALSQSFMHGTTVFDGARFYNGCAPDLENHFSRLLASVDAMGLKIEVNINTMIDITKEGIKKFNSVEDLYIRPSVFATGGFLIPNPDSSKFVMSIFKAPMPPKKGWKTCLAWQRRPNPEMAPTMAKASCLYPNSALAIREAHKRGFDNAIIRDSNGNIAEFASANLWIVKNNCAITPEWNGTFLNGITKARVSKLLHNKGIEVLEKKLTYDDILCADEVFSTGNFGKVVPVTKVEHVDYEIGKITQTAIDSYLQYALKSKF